MGNHFGPSLCFEAFHTCVIKRRIVLFEIFNGFKQAAVSTENVFKFISIARVNWKNCVPKIYIFKGSAKGELMILHFKKGHEV